jgi:hypothetical protein
MYFYWKIKAVTMLIVLSSLMIFSSIAASTDSGLDLHSEKVDTITLDRLGAYTTSPATFITNIDRRTLITNYTYIVEYFTDGSSQIYNISRDFGVVGSHVAFRDNRLYVGDHHSIDGVFIISVFDFSNRSNISLIEVRKFDRDVFPVSVRIYNNHFYTIDRSDLLKTNMDTGQVSIVHTFRDRTLHVNQITDEGFITIRTSGVGRSRVVELIRFDLNSESIDKRLSLPNQLRSAALLEFDGLFWRLFSQSLELRVIDFNWEGTGSMNAASYPLTFSVLILALIPVYKKFKTKSMNRIQKLDN